MPEVASSRKEIADGLKKAACSYLLHKGYSCHVEIGIEKFGKFKADVLAVNLKSELVIVEVKSCPSDFHTDDKKGKWLNYLPACHKLYFLFTEKTTRLLERHLSRIRESGCGVLVLDSNTGYLRCLHPAKYRPMKGATHKYIVTRLAWRSGDISKRNSRRVRVFFKGQ